MKTALLILMALTTSGCSSLPANFNDWMCGSRCKYSNQNGYFGSTETQAWAKAEGEKHKEQWSEWDNKYISDDVITVEFVDPKHPNK